ncbi:MAG: DMT family transporter [Rhodospirillales bacterium]|nr:DMT family transporter [Rhodospirillales bacterium]
MAPLLSSVSRAFAELPSAARGIAFMLAGGLLAALMMAMVRHVSEDLHPFVITFWRSLFGVVVLVPLYFRHGIGALKTRRHGMHVVRGSLNAVVTLSMFMGFSMIPLAKAAALSFSGPLFSTLLAVFLLGEVLRLRRVVALIFGFTGALVILRPGWIEIDTGSLYMLLGAATWGAATIVVKILVRTEASTTIVMYMSLYASAFALIAAIPVWQMPDANQFVWLAALGACGSLTHICFAQSLRVAEVSLVLPLDFMRLIWSAIIGYVVFTETPVIWTWLGGFMIFSAATYIAIRESRREKAGTGRTQS